LYLSLATLLAGLLGIGYLGYQTWLHEKRVRAENLNSQGAIYLEQGQPDLAIPLFQEAIEVDQQNATAYHNLGMAYYLQDNLEQAIEQFQMAIDRDSAYASPHFGLGRLYDDQGRTEEALTELQRALELDPGMSEAYNEVGYILIRQGKYNEAIIILQKGLEEGREPSPPYLHKNLGWAYLELANSSQAVNHLEIAAASLRPGDSLYIEVHRLLARAYEEKGDFEKALQEWQGPLWNEPDAQEHIERLSQ
jgi:tetratricopeptide (TPR) repeat protein